MLPILRMSYRYFAVCDIRKTKIFLSFFFFNLIFKLQHGTMSSLIRQGGVEELRNVLKQHFDKVRF
jgi:hypothetical protein